MHRDHLERQFRRVQVDALLGLPVKTVAADPDMFTALPDDASIILVSAARKAGFVAVKLPDPPSPRLKETEGDQVLIAADGVNVTVYVENEAMPLPVVVPSGTAKRFWRTMFGWSPLR